MHQQQGIFRYYKGQRFIEHLLNKCLRIVSKAIPLVTTTKFHTNEIKQWHKCKYHQ